MQHNVAHQVENLWCVVDQARRVDGSVAGAEARRGAERRSKRIDFLGDLFARAMRSAFVEHVRCERREAGNIGGIGQLSGANPHRERDGGQLVVFEHDDRQAIGQLDGGGSGKLHAQNFFVHRSAAKANHLAHVSGFALRMRCGRSGDCENHACQRCDGYAACES